MKNSKLQSKKLSKLKSKNTIKVGLVLFILFIFAFIVRIIFLSKGSLTFGYDQARDAFNAKEILSGHLKILGPPASTPGLFHGVFYYYVLAIAYAFGPDPVHAAYLIALLNSISVFVVFLLGYLFTRKVSVGIISGILFVVSFESIQYATWLSNPTLGILTVPLTYLGLWIWIGVKKEKWSFVLGPFLCGLGIGLSIQSEIFLFYHFVPVILWLLVFKKNIFKKSLVIFFGTFFISISSMIVAQFKFGFTGISGVFKILTTQDAIVASRGFGDLVILFLNEIGKSFAYSSYPLNIGYGGGLVFFLSILLLYQWKKEMTFWRLFLFVWLFSHVTVVSLGGTSTPFLLVGIAPAVCVLLGSTLDDWWRKKHGFLAAITFFIVIVSNLVMVFRQGPNGSTIFAIQKDLILRNEIAAIDFTYQKANGKPFSISTLTSPLYINTTWSYLYNWYGISKYGYLPFWVGNNQIGQLGNNLVNPGKNVKEHFFIMEPTYSIPDIYITYAKGDQDAISNIKSQSEFGTILVQERQAK